MKKCPRCGKTFKPILLKELGQMSNHCDTCGVRNIFDGLGLPTPPELLDRHTRKPTLTETEFRAALRDDKD